MRINYVLEQSSTSGQFFMSANKILFYTLKTKDNSGANGIGGTHCQVHIQYVEDNTEHKYYLWTFAIMVPNNVKWKVFNTRM